MSQVFTTDAGIPILAPTESRAPPQSEKQVSLQSPHDNGPVEQFSNSSGHKVPISSQVAVPRECLNVVWGAACLGRPCGLGKSLCPHGPAHSLQSSQSMWFPNAPICSSCRSHRSTVTNSVNSVSPTDVIDIWEMHPSVFQWHEHERGAASFSAPSSPSLPAPSCGPPASQPGDSCSSRKAVGGPTGQRGSTRLRQTGLSIYDLVFWEEKFLDVLSSGSR